MGDTPSHDQQVLDEIKAFIAEQPEHVQDHVRRIASHLRNLVRGNAAGTLALSLVGAELAVLADEQS